MKAFRLKVCGLALLASSVLPLMAQQSMVFSRPAQDVTEKANDFMGASQKAGTAGSFNAPKSIFSSGRPVPLFDNLPGAPAPSSVSPDQAAQWQKLLEGKKKWTLLTPEEILGVPTAGKILGIPESKALQNMTPEQRYLARQDVRAAYEATNHGAPRMEYLRGDDNSFSADSRRNANDSENFSSRRRMDYGAVKLFGGGPEEAPSLVPKQESAWTSAFAQPALPKPTPEQLAGMERFRQLMEPSATPIKSVIPGVAAVIAPNPLVQSLPQFNPLGRSAMPVQNKINRPTGVAPLPTLINPYPTTPVKSVQAQLPPWLVEGPKKTLQRKF